MTGSISRKKIKDSYCPILQILQVASAEGASDIYLKPNLPPRFRARGRIIPFKNSPRLPNIQSVSRLDIENFLLRNRQKGDLEVLPDKADANLAFRSPMIEDKGFNFQVTLKGNQRFRCHVSRGQGLIQLFFRSIQNAPNDFREFNIPMPLMGVDKIHSGLVLVGGKAGAGKSTTLAAIIQHLNLHKERHIVTLEDPIEFVYKSERCEITQREKHLDFDNFAEASEHILRQDPDVIVIGEIRDQETATYALELAETGHLVLATIHASSTFKIMERFVSFFEVAHQRTVRKKLAMTAQALVCQKLIGIDSNSKQLPLFEWTFLTHRMRKLIEDSEELEFLDAIEFSNALNEGQSFDQHLVNLVLTKKLPLALALEHASARARLEIRIQEITGENSSAPKRRAPPEVMGSVSLATDSKIIPLEEWRRRKKPVMDRPQLLSQRRRKRSQQLKQPTSRVAKAQEALPLSDFLLKTLFGTSGK